MQQNPPPPHNTVAATRYSRALTIFVLLCFLLSTTLLSAWLALRLDYPSLWNADASFWEYASPLPFGWGFAHLPFLVIFGTPLLLLQRSKVQFINRYRLFCLLSFTLLTGLQLLDIDDKNPFLLFPKVDAALALLVSFALRPVKYQQQPRQFILLATTVCIAMLAASIYAITLWQHRTPHITQTLFVDQQFELAAIDVVKGGKKELAFRVNLLRELPEQTLCPQAQLLAAALLQHYPFDSNYQQLIEVHWQRDDSRNSKATAIGEISLQQQHRSKDGQFACYLKYR